MADFYDQLLDKVPAPLLSRSGRVVHSGREAFSAPSQLYLLALNPGVNPKRAGDTIQESINQARAQTQPWSVYAIGKPLAGDKPFHHRVFHLLRKVVPDRDPCTVPAANLVFVRSPREAVLAQEKKELLRACWRFHVAVIEQLEVRVIVCMGRTTGKWVRKQLGATVEADTFRESNARGWASRAHKTRDGRYVVTLAHPSIADWKSPDSDPSPLVRHTLARAT